jgi:DNA-binding response OmpR family regulator
MQEMSTTPKPVQGWTVLVVEDHGLIAMEVCAALTDAGAIVLGPFSSVAAALARLETTTPDAAILDMSLLDGDAAPIARALTRKAVPFVFYSGTQPSVSGVTWVAKPAQTGELLAVFVEQVRAHKAAIPETPPAADPPPET